MDRSTRALIREAGLTIRRPSSSSSLTERSWQRASSRPITEHLFRASFEGDADGRGAVARLPDQGMVRIPIDRPARWDGAEGQGLLAVRPEDIDGRPLPPPADSEHS